MTSKELEKIMYRWLYSAEYIPDIILYREAEKLVNESIVRFVRDSTWIVCGIRNSVWNSITSKSREYEF